MDKRSVWQCKAQGYIGLELGGVVVWAVGLVAPAADGLGGGGGQEGVSAKGTDVGDRAVFGHLNFENHVASAMGGAGIGRILRFGTGEEPGFGFRGS